MVTYIHQIIPLTNHIIISCQSSVTATLGSERFNGYQWVWMLGPCHSLGLSELITQRLSKETTWAKKGSKKSLRNANTKQPKHMKVTEAKWRWNVTTVTDYFHSLGLAAIIHYCATGWWKNGQWIISNTI